MTPERKAEIIARWKEIDRELEELWAGRVVADDPATREGELLEEQDALDYELSMSYFEDR